MGNVLLRAPGSKYATLCDSFNGASGFMNSTMSNSSSNKVPEASGLPRRLVLLLLNEVPVLLGPRVYIHVVPQLRELIRSS